MNASSLDELESAVSALAARTVTLTTENARLRAELADINERMKAASLRLRTAAAQLPSESVVTLTEIAP